MGVATVSDRSLFRKLRESHVKLIQRSRNVHAIVDKAAHAQRLEIVLEFVPSDMGIVLSFNQIYGLMERGNIFINSIEIESLSDSV